MWLSRVRGRFSEKILSTLTAVFCETMAEGRQQGRRCRTSAAQGGPTSSRFCRRRLQRRAQRGAQTRRAVCGAVSGREGGRPPLRGAPMRREAAGEPPKGAAVITFIRPKAEPSGRRPRTFVSIPPAGVFPRSGSHSRHPTDNWCCVLWWCVLWQGGKRANAEGCAASAAAGCESSSPAASAAAVPKACPQGGDKSEQVGKANGALQRRAAKAAALPRAGRSDAVGGASETLKQTNSN